jgi:hypothetical protein
VVDSAAPHASLKSEAFYGLSTAECQRASGPAPDSWTDCTCPGCICPLRYRTGIAADAVSNWFRRPASVGPDVSLLSIPGCLPNTRDQLRGAHDLALVHNDRATHGASTRLQPPLVSCIALLARSLISREALRGLQNGGRRVAVD